MCLKSANNNMTNIYTNALLAYTFSLAGQHELLEKLLQELDHVAISKGIKRSK